MTFEAKLGDVGPHEQTRIRRTVRRVTAHATVDLTRRVREDERSRFVAVAAHADAAVLHLGETSDLSAAVDRVAGFAPEGLATFAVGEGLMSEHSLLLVAFAA